MFYHGVCNTFSKYLYSEFQGFSHDSPSIHLFIHSFAHRPLRSILYLATYAHSRDLLTVDCDIGLQLDLCLALEVTRSETFVPWCGFSHFEASIDQHTGDHSRLRTWRDCASSVSLMGLDHVQTSSLTLGPQAKGHVGSLPFNLQTARKCRS